MTLKQSLTTSNLIIDPPFISHMPSPPIETLQCTLFARSFVPTVTCKIKRDLLARLDDGRGRRRRRSLGHPASLETEW